MSRSINCINNKSTWWGWPDGQSPVTIPSPYVETFKTDDHQYDEDKYAARNLMHVTELPAIVASWEDLPPCETAQNGDRRWSTVKEIFRLMGPGWLVAMAYVDPGNLEGDLVAGALRNDKDPETGYRLLWVLLWATAMGFCLQRLAIKLGTATNKDLASLCRQELPRYMSISIWFITELCLMGADVQSVIGSAIGLKLLFGIPLPIGILVTLIDTFLVLLIDFYGTRKLEGCFALMISIMAGCFFVNMVTSKPSATSIVKGLIVISVPEGSWAFAIALIGSIIMPHNFFLQSAVVQARPFDKQDIAQVKHVTRVYSIETFCLLAASLAVNIAVVVAFANPKISTNTSDGSGLDMYNAHLALASAIGQVALLFPRNFFLEQNSASIWGLGLLAAGQCSTMACTYSGQFIMEGLLGLRIKRLWIRVFITRLTAILPLLFLIVMSRQSVETVANWVNVMQAITLPFTLVLLLKFTSSKTLMGVHTLSSTTRIIGYTCGVFLIAANLNLSISHFGAGNLYALFTTLLYLAILLFLWSRPLKSEPDLPNTFGTYSTALLS